VQAPRWQPTTTLRDALVQAYGTNPDLAGERANQRANDENVPIARSQGLPGVSSTGSVSDSLYDTDSTFAAELAGWTLGLNLSVPMFSGGAVRNSVKAAETRVERGSANLRGTEADVFTQTVTAYVERAARRGGRAAQPAERPRARGEPPGDARPVRGRRPDPHRRRPVRGAAGAGAEPAANRRGTTDRQPRKLISAWSARRPARSRSRPLCPISLPTCRPPSRPRWPTIPISRPRKLARDATRYDVSVAKAEPAAAGERRRRRGLLQLSRLARAPGGG
jgi:outer membrane protein